MAEELSLFGAWASPFSKRVEMALKLKGVEYDYFDEDMHKPSQWVCRQNPIFQNVPVLLHDGDSIIDPIIILEYIDETWKHNPLFPPDSKGRARARFLIKVIDEKCIPAFMAASLARGIAKERATQDALALLQILEDERKDNKKFFGGDNVGAVDLAASFLALWLGVIEEMNGIKLLTGEKFPKLCRWVGDFLGCNVIKESLPRRDQLLVYHQTISNNPNFFPQGNPPMAGGPFPFPPQTGGPFPFPPM